MTKGIGTLTVLAAALLGSCAPASEPKAEGPRQGDLEMGVAARVGSEVVTVSQVRAMVEATGVAPEEARRRLTYDTLMAHGAKSLGYADRADVVTQRRAALARALQEQLRREAEAQPIADEEVNMFTQRHWLDFDRPVARRTTHAVVMPADPQDPTQMAKAEEVATRIAQAVRGESDPKEFRRKAEAVEAGEMKVLVQDLGPVTEDGRVADLASRPPPGVPPQRYDEKFAEGVFAIAGVGGQSKPVRTKFGYHVILLVEIQPEKRVSFERRRDALTSEIQMTRLHTKLDTLIARLREQAEPSISRNANAIMQLAPVSPSEGP